MNMSSAAWRGPSSIPSSSLGRENNFNVLRLLFASLVLLSHAPEIMDGNRDRELLSRLFHTVSFGELAVAGFFLLSGFLIVQSWEGMPHVGKFLEKRILRIYPGFLVASLICALAVGPLAANAAQYAASFSVSQFLLGMLTLARPEIPPVFQGMHYPLVNGSMWTISLEFGCYLSVLLLGLAGVFNRPVALLTLTAALWTLNLLPHVADFAPTPFSQLAIHYPFIHLMAVFCVGACFHVFRHRVVYSRPRLMLTLAILVIGLFSHRLSEVILAGAGAYLLFWVAFSQNELLARFRQLPDVSYGVYLYGWPVQMLLIWYWPHTSPWLVFVMSLLICLSLGWMSWQVVEKPCLKLKGWRGKAPETHVTHGITVTSLKN
jgi:peptidoglycan/LPS O-acetylase OafA/YrhL